MNRNEAEEIFEAVGGKRKLIAWAKLNSANYAQLLQMLGRSVLQDVGGDGPHAEPTNPAAMEAQAESVLLGIIRARTWPGIEHQDINDTAAHDGIEETPVPQALLPSKPDDAKANVAQHVAVVARKPSPSSSIVGLYNPNGSVHPVGDDPNGRNFSQNIASHYETRGW